MLKQAYVGFCRFPVNNPLPCDMSYHQRKNSRAQHVEFKFYLPSPASILKRAAAGAQHEFSIIKHAYNKPFLSETQ